MLWLYIVTVTFDAQKRMHTKHVKTNNVVRTAHQQCHYNALKLWISTWGVFQQNRKLCIQNTIINPYTPHTF